MTTPLTPKRGAWVTLTLAGGREMVCRFIWAGKSGDDGARCWYVDHGIYGPHRDDYYVPEGVIAAVTLAVRPTLLLSFRDRYGQRIRVGRYVSHKDAERAMGPKRGLAFDYRIKARP